MNLEHDLERLTRSGLLDGLEEWPVDDVRHLRDECREVEAKVSYRRRVLQGRLDIVLAERERRQSGGDLVDSLPSILADRPIPGPRTDRTVGVIEDEDDAPADMDADLGLPGDAAPYSMTDLPDLSAEELSDFIETLAESERRLSEQRRSLLDHLDRLQEELVARYRDGRADVGQVVEPSGDAPDS